MFWRKVVSLMPRAAGWLSLPTLRVRWARRLCCLSTLLPAVLCGCLTSNASSKLDTPPGHAPGGEEAAEASCTGQRRGGLDPCATIPKGAVPAARGTYVNTARNAQAAKAEADDFVFYKQEWCPGAAELGPCGTYHLGQVIKRIGSRGEAHPEGMPFPVLVQADVNPQLNEARRVTLINKLAQAGVSNAAQRVVVGFPEAEGVYGDEAPAVNQQMLQARQVHGGFTGFGLTGGFSGGYGGGYGGTGFNGFGGFGGFGGPGFGR